MPLEITEVWVFVAVDENGDEGVCGFYSEAEDSWIPMVCADKERVDTLRPLAQALAKRGSEIRLYHLSERAHIESFRPES